MNTDYKTMESTTADNLEKGEFTVIATDQDQLRTTTSSSTLQNICDNCLGCVSCLGTFIAGCTFIGTILGIIGGAISLYVFSIIALVDYSNNDITDKCNESNMWIYLLVAVIVGAINGSNSKNTNEDNYGIHLIGTLPMLIWGCIEFWDVSCVNEIENTSIYYMANIWFIIYWIGSSIIGLFLLLGTCGLLTYVTAFAVSVGNAVRRRK